MYSKLPQIDYVNLSPKDLREIQEQAHDAEIAFQAQQREEIRQECTDLAANRGFSIEELYPEFKRGSKKQAHKKPLVVKYVNPNNSSETWTGRGRKPNWLVATLKKGADLASFEVGAKQPTAPEKKATAKKRGGKGGTRPKKLYVNPKNPEQTYKGYGPSPDWMTPDLPNVYGQAA